MATGAPERLNDPFMQFTAGLFKNVWTRPGLTRRERRLITLTAIAASGPAEIVPHHLNAALKCGDLSKEDLLEWVVQLAHYAGWPSAAQAYNYIQLLDAEE